MILISDKNYLSDAHEFKNIPCEGRLIGSANLKNFNKNTNKITKYKNHYSFSLGQTLLFLSYMVNF